MEPMHDHTSAQDGRDPVDLVILQAMARHLDKYLSRDRVYLPMAVDTPEGPKWPTMSIGAMLMRLARLRARADALSPEQRASLKEIEEEMERARRWYPDAYRDRAVREISSLVHSWRWFLDDCYGNIERCREVYPAEARIRTTIQLLVDHLGESEVPAQTREQIWLLDNRLHGHFQPGEFIWPPELASVFPRSRFWWLYGMPSG